MLGHVTLFVSSRSPHTSQIISGFLMLAEQKIIDLEIQCDFTSFLEEWRIYCIEADVSGKKVTFDMEDGCYWTTEKQEYLSTRDFYFKRSFCRIKNEELAEEQREKVFPLGFNYLVTYPGNPLDQARSLKEVIRKAVKPLLKGWNDSYFTPQRFCAGPSVTQKPQIIFNTRIWEPNTGWTHGNEERKYINQMRIEIICKLRERYRERFTGGIEDNAYARKLCPELILPTSSSNRKKYIDKMKQTEICIGSMGLHQSIGWKTGEYVAASRAIVNEELHYEVPGPFQEGQNYLSYHGAEECLYAVSFLMEHPQEILKMQTKNQTYYERYLRPDMLVKNAISLVLEKNEE